MVLYVYFKFIPVEFSQAEKLIRLMQLRLLSEFPGLNVDLLKRSDVNEAGQETWMEVYVLGNHNYNLFLKSLNQLVNEFKLPQPRKNEDFIKV
jgi:hypothetical protein